MRENLTSAVDFPGQSRIHVGLAVADIARSKRFYAILFGTEASKERPGYAKFEPFEPSVNLALNQVPAGTRLPIVPLHYGIQVKSTAAVKQALERFRQAGLATEVEEQTACCHAIQDKVWVSDPDGNRWEVFVVTQADAEQPRDPESECCGDDRQNEPCCVGATTSCC